jgi:hypothetical protein
VRGAASAGILLHAYFLTAIAVAQQCKMFPLGVDRTAEVESTQGTASTRDTPLFVNNDVVPTDKVRETQARLTLEEAAQRTEAQSVNKVLVGFLKVPPYFNHVQTSSAYVQ